MAKRQQCALPGCDVIIELDEGDQPRKYCCPEHRRASRFSRRVQDVASTPQPVEDVELSPVEGPSLFDPATLEVPERMRVRSNGARLDIAPPPVSREQRRRPVNRRQRTIAVLATMAVFAGAGWAASTQPTNTAPSPSSGTAMPASDVPVPTRTAAEWASEAEQTLKSVDQQLDLIAQTEEMWNRQPVALRSGTPPPPVQDMLGRRVALSQQRTLLQLQLDNYHSIDQAERELDVAEKKVAAAERAMPPNPSSPNSPSARQLAEQRDLLARQRDAKREERASLHAAVQKSAAAPLPDKADRTKPITDSVLGLVHDPLRRRPPSDPDKQQPAATPPRDAQPRPRRDVGSVAPPRPGLPALGLGLGVGGAPAPAPARTPTVPTAPSNAATPKPAPDTAGPAEATPGRATAPVPRPAPANSQPANSQPAMSMLDPSRDTRPQRQVPRTAPSQVPSARSNSQNQWRPSPAPRANGPSWDLSQYSEPSGPTSGSPSGWVVSRGSRWSASDARAQFRDGPSRSRGGSGGGGPRGGSRGGSGPRGR